MRIPNRATTNLTFALVLTFVLVLCLTTFGALLHNQELKDKLSLETLAAGALQQFLKTAYKPGSGRSLSASSLNSWLAKNKISLSKLPDNISADIRKGAVEALLIPDVSNPSLPGDTGDVVIVRSKCLLSTTGCSHRGLLIPPPSFFGKGAEEEQQCEYCNGCEGHQPPNCDATWICICTQQPCSRGRRSCPACTGC